jgi:DNA-binding transcriptional MocR family regulator
MAGPRYSIIPADAVMDRELSRLALHVLTALGTHADNNGWCIVKQKTLAERIGSTPNSIANALRELIKRGYVRSRQRHGMNGVRLANLYQIVMDREPSEALVEDGISDAPPPSTDGGYPHAQMGVPPTPTWGSNKNDPSLERPLSPVGDARRRARPSKSSKSKPANGSSGNPLVDTLMEEFG